MNDYEVMTNDYEGSSENQNVESPTGHTYRIRIHDCGSVYARRLYDVDGNVLRDSHGNLLNVYTAAMNDAFANGELRLVRSLRYDYRYFITDEEQKQRFLYERQFGSEFPHVKYYVYRDRTNEYEDVANNRSNNRRQ